MERSLSPREVEVLKWIAEGKTAAEIGIIVGIHKKTVESASERIKMKKGLKNLAEMVRYAVREGLVEA